LNRTPILSYRRLGAALLWLLAAPPAAAGGLTSLVSPGQVIQGHAKVESDCAKCHQSFRKSSQNRLCLDCHDKVAADVHDNKGYHGRIKGTTTTECKTCHTEHRGRDADVVAFDKETFDHKATDLPLKGRHATTTCALCHRAKAKYRDAPSACVDCHKRDDAHRGKLGAKCASCHNETDWRQTKFNHDKTDYPLKGGHKSVACNSCHFAQRYKKTPTDCVACHAVNDPHGARYGRKCDSCHSERKWSAIAFDHRRDTDFPLTGRHDKVQCDTCHRGDLYQDTLDTKCSACHKNDDVHKRRNGEKCANCHSPRSWTRLAFDHDRDTKYPLRGKHAKVSCQSCHRGDIYREQLDTACATCHRLDDVHKGQEGAHCDRCHNEQAWGNKLVFDHGLTRFPLAGLHAAAPCEECHLASTFKNAPIACAACHEKDDVHKKRLPAACELCHNPNGWALWTFDHDRESDFTLDGAHAGLDCHACHRQEVGGEITLSTYCHVCHKQDDTHQGAFGQSCERCHGTKDFHELKLGP